MTSHELDQFEDLLWEAFKEDVNLRELRLSPEERNYLKVKYPKASLKRMLSKEYRDGKVWYEVSFQ